MKQMRRDAATNGRRRRIAGPIELTAADGRRWGAAPAAACAAAAVTVAVADICAVDGGAAVGHGGVLGFGVVVQFPHVLLEVEVAAKAFTADAAGERLLLVMCVHVEGEVVDLVEGLVAHDTLVGLFHAVRQLVILVVALLVEALAAELADERLETGVDAHVRVQRRRPVEGLTASGALVRLVRRVDDLVPAQRRRLSESFAAHLRPKPFISFSFHFSGVRISFQNSFPVI